MRGEVMSQAPNGERETMLSDQSGVERPGTLPEDPAERLAALESSWAEVVKCGFVSAVTCDNCERDQYVADDPSEYGCCEGFGWVWAWAPSPGVASDEGRS